VHVAKNSSRSDQPESDFLRLFLAKIQSACIFIAFQLGQVGRSNQLLTVKRSRLLFNFSAGWSFGEAQQREFPQC
jgi:hypothetical protein